MTTATVRFRYPLAKKALHIDYLRLRCGREPAFSRRIARDFRNDVGAEVDQKGLDSVIKRLETEGPRAAPATGG